MTQSLAVYIVSRRLRLFPEAIIIDFIIPAIMLFPSGFGVVIAMILAQGMY